MPKKRKKPKPLTPEQIRAIREDHGWTQEDAAEAAGCSLRAWKHWEAGDRTPTGSALALLHILKNQKK